MHEIDIHTLQWAGDQPFTVEAAEHHGAEATTLLHGIVVVDGVPVEGIGHVEIRMGGGEFTTVKCEVVAKSVRIVPHTGDDWPPTFADADG